MQPNDFHSETLITRLPTMKQRRVQVSCGWTINIWSGFGYLSSCTRVTNFQTIHLDNIQRKAWSYDKVHLNFDLKLSFGVNTLGALYRIFAMTLRFWHFWILIFVKLGERQSVPKLLAFHTCTALYSRSCICTSSTTSTVFTCPFNLLFTVDLYKRGANVEFRSPTRLPSHRAPFSYRTFKDNDPKLL